MVQAADFWNRDDHAQVRWLDWPPVRRILVEREMSASLLIVAQVAGQDATQVSCAKDENMIQALAPDRADEPLREGILPRASGSREDLVDLHALYALAEGVTVDRHGFWARPRGDSRRPCF